MKSKDNDSKIRLTQKISVLQPIMNIRLFMKVPFQEIRNQ
ncbi:hypothetical protein LEP1GSC005_3417 [Leptospira santarosai str. ST188]|nr:Uncharacterized protein XB15_00492 [Leptospira santarosai]EMF90730.1 hypothetical protein LEP1GSC005_3417 [Leptospira santarosai str. ST188]EMO71117.1 hypothetical protein LEP1GSC130_1043 [Leptospira santarosai str. 200403458]EMO98870.1 hypothetical protein LEP1GSC120_1952 [Leptospira santarosai str. 200702252]